eukprot:4483532-Pyramimonas_sp.AAC.1
MAILLTIARKLGRGQGRGGCLLSGILLLSSVTFGERGQEGSRPEGEDRQSPPGERLKLQQVSVGGEVRGNKPPGSEAEVVR